MTTIVDETHTKWDAAAMLDALAERVNRFRVADLAITYCNAAWAAQYDSTPTEPPRPHAGPVPVPRRARRPPLATALLGPDRPVLRRTAPPRASPNGPGQWLEWIDRYLDGADGPEVLSIGRDVTDRHNAEHRARRERGPISRPRRQLGRRRVASAFDRPRTSTTSARPSRASSGIHRRTSSRTSHGCWTSSTTTAARRSTVRSAASKRSALRLPLPSCRRLDRHRRDTDDHGRGGLQGVSRDVTELRRLQDGLPRSRYVTRSPGWPTDACSTSCSTPRWRARSAAPSRWRSPTSISTGSSTSTTPTDTTAGDPVYRETARRLLAIVRDEDVVARVGGDEFVIVYGPNDATRGRFIVASTEPSPTPINIAPATISSAARRASVPPTPEIVGRTVPPAGRRRRRDVRRQAGPFAASVGSSRHVAPRPSAADDVEYGCYRAQTLKEPPGTGR